MSRSSHSDHEMYGGDGHVGHTTAPGGFSNPTPPPAPPYAAPYVVQYPGGAIRWSTGLCHCTDDPANCFITCCCPCITFGQIAEIVSRGSSNCAESGALYALLCLTGLGCLYSCGYRSRLRAQYDLEESPCVDCLVHFCCEGCSLCQEYRELKNRGLDMGIEIEKGEMEEEEHEVYGGEIPDEGEMEGDMDAHNADVDMATNDDDAVKELDEMKKRLKEMEEEAAALREMQAKVEKEMGAVQDPVSAAATQASKEETDSRSVFVGNVDYACTPEEVQQHFQPCGTVNRVTILTDKFGQPKGFAYVEFLEVEAVQEALLLNESELHGRQLKVLAKRTNVPGMKQFRPRRFNPYMGYRFRRPYVPPYFYSPYGYGKVPRFRRPMRYMPYY